MKPHIVALTLRIIAEIQAKSIEIAEAIRPESPNLKGPIDLNLERLIGQTHADAEIASYCSTPKSRKDRREALIRSAASSLLALVQMEQERVVIPDPEQNAIDETTAPGYSEEEGWNSELDQEAEDRRNF